MCNVGHLEWNWKPEKADRTNWAGTCSQQPFTMMILGRLFSRCQIRAAAIRSVRQRLTPAISVQHVGYNNERASKVISDLGTCCKTNTQATVCLRVSSSHTLHPSVACRCNELLADKDRRCWDPASTFQHTEACEPPSHFLDFKQMAIRICSWCVRSCQLQCPLVW